MAFPLIPLTFFQFFQCCRIHDRHILKGIFQENYKWWKPFFFASFCLSSFSISNNFSSLATTSEQLQQFLHHLPHLLLQKHC